MGHYIHKSLLVGAWASPQKASILRQVSAQDASASAVGLHARALAVQLLAVGASKRCIDTR